MKIKKSVLIGATAAVVGVTSLAGIGIASAATTATNGNSLVDKIATKFGLKKADVQAVFDQNRTEKEAERLQNVKDTLAQAVKDGKLTQAQADAITTKMTEMKTFMDSLKDKTADERHTAMDAKRDELKKWADDNSIPEAYRRFVMGGPGRGMGMGGHMHGMMDEQPADSAN
jgi:polyhydroxyalkanoate synthesis regulator phasin